MKLHLGSPALQHIQIAPYLRSFSPAVELAPSSPLHQSVEQGRVCEEKQIRKELMKYVFVNGISFDNIVSDLKDADYGFHFLWSLVTVFVCVLEWICVQDRWKSDIQDLIENIIELSKIILIVQNKA